MNIEAKKEALEALEAMKSDRCAEEKIHINSAIAFLRQSIEQAEKQEPDLPPVEIGVDVTEHGATVVAFYRRPNAVMEMFYSQFHPQPKQAKNPPIHIQNHTHTDHPMQHWDRTCPACVSEEKNWVPREVVYKNSVYQTPDGFTNIQNKICDQQTEKQEPVALQSIEQYAMQMAAICTAAIGYWKESDNIHPDCDSLALRDVAKLYAKYAELYTAPPRKEWVGLTDEERRLIRSDFHGSLDTNAYSRAIEAKLKEKNT